MKMITKNNIEFLIGESTEEDGTAPIMITSGTYEGTEFNIGSVSFGEDGESCTMSYSYDLVDKTVDKTEELDKIVGDVIISILTEKLAEEDNGQSAETNS